jgi:hypothetical protein
MEMQTATISASLAAAGAAPKDNYGKGFLPMDNGNAYDQHATWFLLHVPVLVL